MRVIAKSNLVVESFNARNKEGNKLRKSREIKGGEAFEVNRQFTADASPLLGTNCLEIIGPNEERYQVDARDFAEEKQEQEQVKEESRAKKEENELGRLLRCIREIIEDPENEEFTFGFKQGGHSEEQDEELIRLEKLVEGKKIFVQGWIESRYISPTISGPQVKYHMVIYFRNSAGDTHKKWIYPSTNRDNNFLKGKIRIIMREWISQLVEYENKRQGENSKIKEEQDQLMKELKEYGPTVLFSSDREVHISYGDSIRALAIGIRLNENNDYVVNLKKGGNSPAFNREGLEVLLGVLKRAK